APWTSNRWTPSASPRPTTSRRDSPSRGCAASWRPSLHQLHVHQQPHGAFTRGGGRRRRRPQGPFFSRRQSSKTQPVFSSTNFARAPHIMKADDSTVFFSWSTRKVETLGLATVQRLQKSSSCPITKMQEQTSAAR